MPVPPRFDELGVFDNADFLDNAAAIRGSLDQRAFDATTRADRGANTALFQARKCEPCSYLLPDSNRAHGRYCDAPSLPGRSYCAGHHRITHRSSRKE